MLLRLLSRLRSTWFAPKPKASKAVRASVAVKASRSMLEPLESRIAPATFINAHIVTYTDVDGDRVTVYSSHPLFTSANVDSILTFSASGATTPQQLQEINLASTSVAANIAAGDNISVTAQKVGGGVGVANVGLIESSFALGNVLVQGDLGAINAGVDGSEGSHYIGLGSLTVNSLGAQGTATQPSGGSLLSTIFGGVGSITVQSDMVGAQIAVSSSTTTSAVNGNINSVKIGGSLIGGANTTTSHGATVFTGNITTDGSINSIFIGKNIEGGSGTNSASFQVGGRIGSLTVDGNVTGYTVAGDTTGQGQGSASIVTGVGFSNIGGIGSLSIKGNLQGGDGENSGGISPESNLLGGVIGSAKIGGAIKGGAGDYSGELSANAFGAISIGDGITGSSGLNSGIVTSARGIGSLTILKGGIVGGTYTSAGSVIAGTGGTGAIGSVLIYGDITGDPTAGSTIASTGQISGTSINTFTLYGSLAGSAATTSGSVLVTDTIGHIAIHAEVGGSAGSLLGGSGSNSGEISAYSIGSVSVAGQILGSSVSSGTGSGKILTTGGIGSVAIGDGITGGLADGSGVVTTGSGGFLANLGSLTITGGGITGGGGADSGQVSVGGVIGSVNLHGTAVTGGAGASSGGIYATDNIGPVSLGSLIAGVGEGAEAGQISTGGNLASLTFTGGSSATAVSGQVNVAGSVGSITVHGDVAGSGASTGLFLIGGGVQRISISGALRGGTGDTSGSIFAGLDNTGVIRSLAISGGVIGNTGNGSGEVFGGGGIGGAAIGDIIGGGGQASGSLVSNGALGAITVTGTGAGVVVNTVTTHGIFGGAGNGSGQVSSGASIGSVAVKGVLQGGSGVGSGAIVSHSALSASGDIPGNIGSVSVTGGIVGGAGADSGQISAAGNLRTVSITGDVTGSIVAANDIGSLTVSGSVTGTYSDPVVISAGGQDVPTRSDLAFGRISVGGGVTYANILAGYDQTGAAVNGAASIGTVIVGGDWSGSNLVAGVLAGTGGHFGAEDGSDSLIPAGNSIIPTIASIIIKGQVKSAIVPAGDTDLANTYGIVAGKIEALSINKLAQPLGSLSTVPINPVPDTAVQDIS